MTELVWDKLDERIYETGLDKGVLYLPDGTAVPWNGLTSIIEKFDRESSSVYYDGMKINEIVVVGDFSATMKAVTYPDEFLELEGIVSIHTGVFLGEQNPKAFGLCYQTKIGNELEGDSVGYKIHLIYNVIAIPNDKTYASLTDSPVLVEFEWNIMAVPEELVGYRPAAHIIIDSRSIDPWLLENIEEILYGNTSTDAALIPIAELVTYINEWYRIKITDNGDGTWTADSDIVGIIDIDEIEQTVIITETNSTFLDPETYTISDTKSLEDIS